MATETFTIHYMLTEIAPGLYSPSSGVAVSHTAFELASDGDGVNGSTDPGADINIEGAFHGSATDTLVGVTSSGDVIYMNEFGMLNMISNTAGLEGILQTVTGAPYTYCFAADTLIATPAQARRVDELSIGDMVMTASGDTIPVKWIGRQTVRKFLAGPHMQPVRIRAGALGEGLPTKDLTVTADHGMIIDDLVINASALVNGTTIDFVPLAELPDRVTYYHVETEAHDIILANGTPAETFVDAVTRANFDNYAEYIDLFGAERIIPEMDRPRISSQRLLPQTIRERLGIVVDAVAFGDIAATMTA